MNVSQINLQHNENDNIYATIRDVKANKNVLIGEGPRHKQLLLSTSHELEITLTKQNGAIDNLFMLHIKGNKYYIRFEYLS